MISRSSFVPCLISSRVQPTAWDVAHTSRVPTRHRVSNLGRPQSLDFKLFGCCCTPIRGMPPIKLKGRMQACRTMDCSPPILRYPCWHPKPKPPAFPDLPMMWPSIVDIEHCEMSLSAGNSSSVSFPCSYIYVRFVSIESL